MKVPYHKKPEKNWIDELKEMNFFIVLFFIIAIAIVLYFGRCGSCGWLGAQIISYKHGGLFHYDCLRDLNNGRVNLDFDDLKLSVTDELTEFNLEG